MADENIKDMTELSETSAGDLYIVIDTSAGTSKKLKAENLHHAFTTTHSRTLLANTTADLFLADLGIDDDIADLALPANTTVSAYGKTLVDDADAETALKTLLIRNSTLLIEEDALVAGKLGCTLTGVWNGDTIAKEDPVTKTTGSTSFGLSGGGTSMTILAAALSGNCIVVLDAEISSNDCSEALSVRVLKVTNDIQISLFHITTGVAQDITAKVALDGGNKSISINITYVTDA